MAVGWKQPNSEAWLVRQGRNNSRDWGALVCQAGHSIQNHSIEKHSFGVHNTIPGHPSQRESSESAAAPQTDGPQRASGGLCRRQDGPNSIILNQPGQWVPEPKRIHTGASFAFVGCANIRLSIVLPSAFIFGVLLVQKYQADVKYR